MTGYRRRIRAAWRAVGGAGRPPCFPEFYRELSMSNTTASNGSPRDCRFLPTDQKTMLASLCLERSMKDGVEMKPEYGTISEHAASRADTDAS
jgi:hypothetical protein